MTKGILVSLVVVFSMISAFAEIEHFTTPINITSSVDQNTTTFKISTEDNQIRTYSSGNTVNDIMTINIYRNTSCKADILYDYILKTDERSNQTASYQNQVIQCNAEKSSMMSDLYFGDNITYKVKYNDCTNQVANLQNNQNQGSQCQTDLTKAKSEKTTQMLIGIGIGIGIGFALWGRKTPQSPVSRLPQVR